MSTDRKGLDRAKPRVIELLQRPRIARAAFRLAVLQSKAFRRAYWGSRRMTGFAETHADPASLAGLSEQADPTQQLRYLEFLAAHVAGLPSRPLISVILPVFRPDPTHLIQALNSVSLQTYDHWQLCIADDASKDPTTSKILRDFVDRHGDDRVKYVVRPENGHISAASNTCLDLATGEWAALLDQDDILMPNALGEIARFLNLRQATGERLPDILYTDEEVVGPDGEPMGDPFFKPDWSPLLHLGVNYTTHLTMYRTELLRQIGGFRVGLEGAQDHELMLRATEAATSDIAHLPLPLYRWRSHPGSTASDGDPKPYAWENGRRAVTDACARRGHPAAVEVDPFSGHYRLAFQLPDPRPLVSVIIPNRDSLELISSCVASITGKSVYDNLELIIVDNGSSSPAVFSFYDSLRRSRYRVNVVRDDDYFNFARLINRGAQAAAGEFLILLNNDTEVQSSDWIEQMLMLAQQPSVGMVGSKLCYPDGTLQHGGIVGAGALIADHAGWGTVDDDRLYIDMPNTVHETLAVTAAASMVRRSLFQEMGGLDEIAVPNGFGDVDFCLRARELGLTNVYTPYAVLTHHESATRKRAVELSERQYMMRRWGAELSHDPYLNPNLARSGQYTPDRTVTQFRPSFADLTRWLSTGEAPWL